MVSGPRAGPSLHGYNDPGYKIEGRPIVVGKA
jgi:hypothetical protein